MRTYPFYNRDQLAFGPLNSPAMSLQLARHMRRRDEKQLKKEENFLLSLFCLCPFFLSSCRSVRGY